MLGGLTARTGAASPGHTARGPKSGDLVAAPESPHRGQAVRTQAGCCSGLVLGCDPPEKGCGALA